MALAYATTLRNNKLDQITSFAGASALLRIYDGTRPATGAAITTQTLLAELTCDATAFAPAASLGVLTPNAVTSDASANATGTGSWFRVVKSDGTTFVMDGDVGTSGSDLNLDSTAISAGVTVAISSWTITDNNG